MGQPVAKMIAVDGTDYVVTLPPLVDGSLSDPVLAKPGAGKSYSPQSLSIIGGGLSQRIIYRWWTDAGELILSLPVHGVAGRHPHRPQFVLVQGEPVRESQPELTLRPWVRGSLRSQPWRQEANGLEADIARTRELHAKVRSWLAAL